jgi:hypothetical protein
MRMEFKPRAPDCYGVKALNPLANIERLHRRRYIIQFDLEYRVFGKGHSICSGAAKTVNISSEGILLTRADGVNKGQLVEISIRWNTGAPGAAVADLEILGRVMRVDASGTAVRILRYGFHPHPYASAAAISG